MRSDYLDPKTYDRLYPLMQYDNILALRVSLETGLRIDDVLMLKWENFEKSGKFTYTAKKTGKTGKKWISFSLFQSLLSRKRGDSYVFPGRKKGSHRTRQAVWRDLKKAAAALKIKGNISPHSARKTYAVGLRRSKGLAAAQRELQHDRADTTMLYAFSDLLTAKPAPSECAAHPDAEAIARRVVELLTPILEEIKKRC